MKCKQCGSEFENENQICPNCGTDNTIIENKSEPSDPVNPVDESTPTVETTPVDDSTITTDNTESTPNDDSGMIGAEVADQLKENAEKAGVDPEEVKKHYADPRAKEYLIDDIKEQRLYDQLLEKCTVKKGKKQTYEEFFGAEH